MRNRNHCSIFLTTVHFAESHWHRIWLGINNSNSNSNSKILHTLSNHISKTVFQFMDKCFANIHSCRRYENERLWEKWRHMRSSCKYDSSLCHTDLMLHTGRLMDEYCTFYPVGFALLCFGYSGFKLFNGRSLFFKYIFFLLFTS